MNRDVAVDDITHTELFTVANGGNFEMNDLVIFADQQLDTSPNCPKPSITHWVFKIKKLPLFE